MAEKLYTQADLEALLSNRSKHAVAVRDSEWVALMDVLGVEFREDLAPVDYVNVALRKQEALLREAEVKGIRWAEGRDIAQTTARLNELEKARASVKDK